MVISPHGVVLTGFKAGGGVVAFLRTRYLGLMADSMGDEMFIKKLSVAFFTADRRPAPHEKISLTETVSPRKGIVGGNGIRAKG